MNSVSNLILKVEVHCHKVQGMTEALTDSRIACIAVQKRPVHQFAKKPYLPLFSSETADKFARDYTIEISFPHALHHLVTAHLLRQNQVAHALRTRDPVTLR